MCMWGAWILQLFPPFLALFGLLSASTEPCWYLSGCPPDSGLCQPLMLLPCIPVLASVLSSPILSSPQDISADLLSLLEALLPPQQPQD